MTSPGLSLLFVIFAVISPSVLSFAPNGIDGASFASASTRKASGGDLDCLENMKLTPKLREIVSGLRGLPDDKMRVRQVLFLAGKPGQDMDESLKIATNKVPGCLSTVYVNAYLDADLETVQLQGDSDSQLTKGLVTLLVDGLSGYTPAEIQEVDQEFIKFAGLGASLTPGRNNGFMNMLNVIKRKARQLDPARTEAGTGQDGAQTETPEASTPPLATSSEEKGAGRDTALYASILQKVKILKPSKIELKEVEASEKGPCYELNIVAGCFEGLTDAKRQQLVTTVLRKEIQGGAKLDVTALDP